MEMNRKMEFNIKNEKADITVTIKATIKSLSFGMKGTINIDGIGTIPVNVKLKFGREELSQVVDIIKDKIDLDLDDKEKLEAYFKGLQKNKLSE